MSSIIPIPIMLGATVRPGSINPTRYIEDPISPYAGFPYEWRLELDISTIGNSTPSGGFDSTHIICKPYVQDVL